MFLRSMLNFAPVILAAVILAAFPAAAMADSFPAFSSQTLDGKPVSDAVFADKKLTMVNLWATWCPPCVKEMPDLASLGSSMPEGAQLIGIVLDVRAEDQRAKGKAEQIASRAKTDFHQILSTAQMDPYTKTVQYIPTTIFVDAEGQIVGEPMVGAHSEADYRAAVESILARLQ
jgi:thiol-disulfide isomerase/thioredoxin